MKTSCIQHPPNAPLVVVHQWQVDAMNGDSVAAKLMSIFEYWHNVKWAIAERSGADLITKDMLIQHHTQPELESALFVDCSRKKIRESLKVLFSAKVITPEKNPKNPHDRSGHFLFHPSVAQSLANNWNKVYSRHREEFGAKRPICIPQNLMGTALGQMADCKTPNGLMESAKRPHGVGQTEECIRPNGLDPKTTIPKTSTKTTNQDLNTPFYAPNREDGQGQIFNSSGDLPISLGKPEKRKSSAKKKKWTAEELEPFRLCWNEHKPEYFAVCGKLTTRRVGQLNQLVKDHGDDSLGVLRDSLLQAHAEKWCKGKNLSFENFLSNDKATSYAERWRSSQSPNEFPPPQSNAERLCREYMSWYPEVFSNAS